MKTNLFPFFCFNQNVFFLKGLYAVQWEYIIMATSLIINNASYHQEGLLNAILYIDEYLTISHLLSAIIGIPLNLGVIGLIVGMKRLHSQRTFTWLGAGLANVFLFLVHLVELQAVYFPSSAAGQLYAATRGLPYVAILLSNVLSFLDRHLCVNCSKWYKRHITSCWKVLIGQMGALVIMCLIFIAARLLFAAIQSQIFDLLDVKMCVVVTFVVGVGTQTVLWAISKWANPPKRTDHQIKLRTIRNINPCSLEDGSLAEGNELDNDSSSPFVLIGQERVSRLDVEAYHTVMIIGLFNLISFVPVLVSLAHCGECLKLQQRISEETKMSCNSSVQILIYLRELINIPCFSFSPIYFVYQSRDILTALRERGWRLGNTSTDGSPPRSPFGRGTSGINRPELNEIVCWDQLKAAADDSEDGTPTSDGIQSIFSIDDRAIADLHYEDI